jgi:hypothetical protein
VNVVLSSDPESSIKDTGGDSMFLLFLLQMNIYFYDLGSTGYQVPRADRLQGVGRKSTHSLLQASKLIMIV